MHVNRPGSVPRTSPRAALFAVFAASGVAAVLYAVDPNGIGGMAFVGVSAVLIMIITVGPIARGARPFRIWGFQMMGGLCLLLSLFSQVVPLTIGPLSSSDVFYFCGYGGLAIWLILLSRHVGGLHDHTALLDSAAVAVGASLALWSTTLAPLVGGSQLPSALVWAVYPTMDALLLALAIHLAIRMGVIVPAMAWLLGALAVLFVLNVANSLTLMLSPTGETWALSGVYVFYFAAVAIAASHPSVVELSRRPIVHTPRPRGNRRTALIVFSISPTIVSAAIPVTSIVDRVVRTTLVAALLALLFARLSRTMTALSRAEADSHERATHDELTGLLNRAALLDAMTALLKRNAAERRSTAVLFLDCDDFKHVNDTWGHHAGDSLLRHIARGLPHRLRRKDVLARHGGDEFVILTTVSGAAEAVDLAERVRAFFDEPIQVLPTRLHTVTPSIGVAVTQPWETVTTEDLLGRADVAMYEAKARGRAQYVVFDRQLAQRSQTRASVGDRLGEAIREEIFSLDLQPIMRGPDFGTLVGWEALARWRDPLLGTVSPGVFIPVAEQLGLISDLGDMMLRRACQELAELRRSLGRDDLVISVNVSPTQLLQPDFADTVCGIRLAAGLPDDALWLEVTETLLVDKGPAVLATLEALQTCGVRICIDDFGTGYASLATLLRLPVDCVKLDRSIAGRLGVDSDAPRQLRAIIEMLRSLGIEQIVAEGVETDEQAAVLRDLGCPMAQGWLYGRPSTPESVLSAHGVSAG